MNKKIIYLSVFLVLGLFLLSSCKIDQETIGGNINEQPMDPLVYPGPFDLSSPSSNQQEMSINPILYWSPSENAVKYKVEVSPTIDFSQDVIIEETDTNILSKQFNGLNGQTVYYWQIWAINNRGESRLAETSPWSFTTNTPIAPSVFNVLTPVDGATSVPLKPTFVWNTANRATSYKLEVSDTSSFSQVISEDNINGNSIQLTSLLESNKLYYWRVYAKNEYGITLSSNVQSFRTTAQVTAPGRFLITSPENRGLGVSLTSTFKWMSATGASSYNIQVSTDWQFNNKIIDERIPLSSGTNYIHSLPLESGAWYYWKIYANNDVGNTLGYFQGNANSGIFRTAYSQAPSSFKQIRPTQGSKGSEFTFSWAPAERTDYYVLEFFDAYSSKIGEEKIPYTKTSYGPTAYGNSGKKYYWQVTAYNSVGKSVSERREFTTTKPKFKK